MSGVFVTVWDDDKNDESDVLRMTKGGVPHFTLLYSGKWLALPLLTDIAVDMLKVWCGRPITLTKAYVNSFEDSPGHQRHDVLMSILESDAIEDARETYVLRRLASNQSLIERLNMRTPHVTHGIYETKDEAARVAKHLNETSLPRVVNVNGVTIYFVFFNVRFGYIGSCARDQCTYAFHLVFYLLQDRRWVPTHPDLLHNACSVHLHPS